MSKEPPVRHRNAGPLALQMGDVTGAVNDLVHGYEQLVHKLPDLTEMVSNVYADTEEMNKQLEHRTRSMIEGYEFLQGLSTQLPELYRETAEQNRKTLQGAIYALSPEEQATIKENEEKLAKIKLEMQSMCHERIVVDVLTRPLLQQTKRLAEAARATNNKEQQDRYSRALTQGPNKVAVNNTTANRVFNSRVVRAEADPRLTTRAIHSALNTPSAHHTTNTPTTHINADHTVVVTNRNAAVGDVFVSYKDTADLFTTPIFIPRYDPNRPKPAPVTDYTPHTTKVSTPRAPHDNELGGYLNFPTTNNTTHYNHYSDSHYGGAEVVHSGYSKLVARAVGPASMVPNMRRGSLPPEVANLHTDPTMAVTAADHLHVTKKRSIKRSVTFVEKETIARSLVTQLKHTDEEVADLKKKLAAAHNKFGKDQSAAIAKLHAIIHELKEGLNGRDDALLKAVEALLREYLSKHKAQPAVNHDAAILKALDALLTPPPPVIDRLQEYKVLTVRPKIPVPVRTVPVIVPVPAPEKVEIEVEVQTDPVVVPEPPAVIVPVPEVVTPAAPPAAAPAPVSVQAPQSIVVNVPAQSGVERELIELMHNVVTTQHATMQGNQALILSLIHERTPVVQEVVYERPATPPPTPPPVVVPPPTPTPIITPPPALPRYSTAFGTVVLGAQSLQGEYTTPPTLIPSDYKPCVLRGILLPETRPVQPLRRVPENKDVLVDGDLTAPHTALHGSGEGSDEVVELPLQTHYEHNSSGPSGTISDNSGNSDDNNVVLDAVGGGNVLGGTGDSPTDPAIPLTTATTNTDPTTIINTNTTTQRTIPTMTPSLGLTLSGTSSTSGRGGSIMHTTPGVEQSIPKHMIPLYMRRKASDFTLRAIMGTSMSAVVVGCEHGISGVTSSGGGGDRVGVNSNTTMYKNSLGFNAEADARTNNTTSNTINSNTTHPYHTSPTNTTNTTFNNSAVPSTENNHPDQPDQGLVNLLRNLQVLSSTPINTNTTNATPNHTSSNTNNTTVLTPESLAAHISEGVQRGVKEALGLMDTHSKHRTYYNTNPSTNDTLHHTHANTNTNNTSAYDRNDYNTRGLLNTNTNSNNIRHSLTLLKNKRSVRSTRTGLNAGVRSTHYADLPHYTNHTSSANYNTNYVEHNHVPNRDVCQPPRRRAIAAQQRNAEHHTIMQDIQYSTTNAHNMHNECDSMDDSVSIDETTAAYLRDPLMHNMNTESVVSSLEYDVVGNGCGNVKLVHRDVHSKRHGELFSSTDNVPIKAHTTRTKHTNNTNSTNNAANSTTNDDNVFLPLVSRVLQQSATEDVLYNQLTRAHHTNNTSTSINSTTSSVDNDRDQDDRMWDLTASAPMVSFKHTTTDKNATINVNTSTSTTYTNPTNPTKPNTNPKYSTHTDGTIANMQLLRPKQYNQNEMTRSGDSDSFVSIGSSVGDSTSGRSILTHSTNSTDVSVNDSNIHNRIEYTSGGAMRANPNTINNNTNTNTNTYKRTSTTDINRANLAAMSMNTSVSNSVNSVSSGASDSTTNSRRVSMLPRYSPHKHTHPTRAHTTHSAQPNTNTDNTELLAAQMMLNVLELHRPSNYTTTPYLSNPISSHLKRNGYSTTARSKIYATESVHSSGSGSSASRRYTNNRYFNTVDSDLDVTGSSISSAPDELLDHGLYNNFNYSDTTRKPSSGLTLMGVGSNKLLRVNRK